MGNETQTGGSHPLGRATMRKVIKARKEKFRDAVLQSNLPLLIDCLGLGVDPNIEIDDDNSALHIAAEKCDLSVLQILLGRANIEVDKKTGSGITSLMIACIVNCREAVQLLLKNGADPDQENGNGHRPLHYACENRSMGIVFDLVAKGADVKICRNIFDVTPLTIAVIDRPSMPIAKFLLRKGANVHGTKQFPLFLESVLACSNNEQLNMFKLLVHNGMNRHQIHPIEKRNCLHYAAMNGYIPLAEYLITLNMEADLLVRDASGRTPMDIAFEHGNYIIFHLFKYAYIRKTIPVYQNRHAARHHRRRSED